MASMRGATRVRRTIQQVRTHFPVLHPSRSAYTHTPRSRDAARTTACSEPWQTSPSTMLIPTRTARSFECRGASSPVAPRLRPDNPAARAATRASQHGADHQGGAHRPVRMLPHSYPHPRRRPLPGAQQCSRRARPPGTAPPVRPGACPARPPGGPPRPTAREHASHPPRPPRPSHPARLAQPRPHRGDGLVLNVWRETLCWSMQLMNCPLGVPRDSTRSKHGSTPEVPNKDTTMNSSVRRIRMVFGD